MRVCTNAAVTDNGACPNPAVHCDNCVYFKDADEPVIVPVTPNPARTELSWGDYSELTAGGIEKPEFVSGVFERLTGESAKNQCAKRVFKTVLNAVRDVTKDLTEAVKE